MKKLLSREFAIGLSVIVAIVILVFGIDYLKGINLFTPANFYVAEYDRVDGLSVSSPILINGYKVGQVREINFNYNKPGKVEVVLALNKDLTLPQGTVATIASTLLSGAYVNLQLGNGPGQIPHGGRVATHLEPDLMAALQSDLMPNVNSVLHRIDSLVYNLNVLVSDPAMYSTIQRLDGISNNLLLASGGLNTTLNKDVPLVMGNVRSVAVNADTVAKNLSVLSRQLRAVQLQPTMQNLETVSNNLAAFSSQLNNRQSTLGQLMYDPELYNRLNSVTAGLDSLIYDIKKNPKRYINIKLL